MEEQVRKFWEDYNKVKVGAIKLVHERLNGKQPPIYFACNLVSIIPSKGGISKCEFMKLSYKMGYVQKRFGMEKTHYIVKSNYDTEDDSAFVMSRVNDALATHLQKQTKCWVESEEILT